MADGLGASRDHDAIAGHRRRRQPGDVAGLVAAAERGEVPALLAREAVEPGELTERGEQHDDVLGAGDRGPAPRWHRRHRDDGHRRLRWCSTVTVAWSTCQRGAPVAASSPTSGGASGGPSATTMMPSPAIGPFGHPPPGVGLVASGRRHISRPSTTSCATRSVPVSTDSATYAASAVAPSTVRYASVGGAHRPGQRRPTRRRTPRPPAGRRAWHGFEPSRTSEPAGATGAVGPLGAARRVCSSPPRRAVFVATDRAGAVRAVVVAGAAEATTVAAAVDDGFAGPRASSSPHPAAGIANRSTRSCSPHAAPSPSREPPHPCDASPDRTPPPAVTALPRAPPAGGARAGAAPWPRRRRGGRRPRGRPPGPSRAAASSWRGGRRRRCAPR